MTNAALLEMTNRLPPTSYVGTLFDKIEKIIHEHRQSDPDLYCLIEEQRLIKAEKQTAMVEQISVAAVDSIGSLKEDSLYFKQYEQKQLKQKIAANQVLIHEQVLATQAMIVPRTKARNVKQPYPFPLLT